MNDPKSDTPIDPFAPLFGDGPRQLSGTELSQRLEAVRALWKNSLEPLGVVFPSPDSNDALCLVALSDGYPNTRPWSKRDLTNFVEIYKTRTNDLQAPRMLGAQRGFWVSSGRRGERANDGSRLHSGEYQLCTLENEYPNWNSARRVQTGDWEELKRSYDYRCATCGSREGEPNRNWPAQVTKLTQGHMDPAGLQGPGNWIPQCDVCNLAYGGHYVFDDRGRVVAVADTRPVLNASPQVRFLIWKSLSAEFGDEQDRP
jgi:hypothetical protein